MMHNRDVARANRRAAWRWGGLVVGLLSLQVLGGIMAILLATGDESVAVVPDYHQKALDWDSHREQLAASESLGWSCLVEVTGEESLPQGLRLRLLDRRGQPVRIAAGQLQIYRHARASDVGRVQIPAGSPGLIALDDCFDARGLWQITLDVTDTRGDRFVWTSELNVGVEMDRQPPGAR